MKAEEQHNTDEITKLSLSSLSLTNFRCYESLYILTDPNPIVLYGANGAGKTNILEAISYLYPGRGLRAAKLNEIDRHGRYPWSMSARIRENDIENHIGTGRDTAMDGGNKRIVRINREQAKTQKQLADFFSLTWLTPQMDGIFLQGLSERRKFLDRMIFQFFSSHATYVNNFENATSQRNKLLQENCDTNWLFALESKMAENAVKIAKARNKGMEIVQQALDKAKTDFPKANLTITGLLEDLLKEYNEEEAIEKYKKILCDNRQRDMAAGRTLEGVHRSDFSVYFSADNMSDNMPAALCSTGEQKALLIAITLAVVRAKLEFANIVPVLLLDEVVAHLDKLRRKSLFAEINSLGVQAWMTGTDKSLFSDMDGVAQFMEVNGGRVKSNL